MSDPVPVSSLLLAARFAYIWVILQGLHVTAHIQTRWIDRTNSQDKSLFRLGLDWIPYCLKRDCDFEQLFWFQPEPEFVIVW